VFALFLTSMGLWGLVILVMRISPDAEHAITWSRAVFPIGALLSTSFLHFSFLYTRTKIREWLIVGAYLLVFVIAGFSSTRLVVQYIDTDIYGYLPNGGPLFSYFAAYYYMLFIIGMVIFARAYKTSTSYEERNSYIYFFVGLSFAMLGGVVDFLSSSGLPVPPVGLIGNILFCILAYFYSTSFSEWATPHSGLISFSYFCLLLSSKQYGKEGNVWLIDGSTEKGTTTSKRWKFLA